ncbi:MAG: prephenate dehydrogenase/arogenate dehydrogenase family protein [Acidimicrobiales bacterium]|nr:prephenate dehydrogenase/arogenate dehydrogenase family protein [Acidimicrobiales bacterium]
MTPPADPETRTALVVGVGLIGGSVGMALRGAGWHVVGVDPDTDRLAAALESGAIDEAGPLGECDLAFIATPVNVTASMAIAALDAGAAVVTDVGSVKAPITAAVDDSRFVPGHPMAGSEQDGLAGAFADMFSGAMWVLCPTETTDDAAFAEVRGVVSSLGAQVIVMPPDRHDTLVAVVSHVPHLTAATLMRLADGRAEEHRSLLRLAAGGFRDMTRIAAGHPAIWPDICTQNQAAITDVLDELIRELSGLRDVVADGQGERLLDHLESARHARRNLPTTALVAEKMSEMRIPVLDRQGEIAAIATLAADLDVNIYDLEIAHSAEGPRGVVVVLVESALAERFQGGLMVQGYRPSIRPLD